jgi:hypothetical protein
LPKISPFIKTITAQPADSSGENDQEKAHTPGMFGDPYGKTMYHTIGNI